MPIQVNPEGMLKHGDFASDEEYARNQNMHKPVLVQHAREPRAAQRGCGAAAAPLCCGSRRSCSGYLTDYLDAETGLAYSADRLRRRRRQRSLRLLPPGEEHRVDLPQLAALPRAARVRLPGRGAGRPARGDPLAPASAGAGGCDPAALLGPPRRHLYQRGPRAAPHRPRGLAAPRRPARLVVAAAADRQLVELPADVGGVSRRRSRRLGWWSGCATSASSARAYGVRTRRSWRRCTTCAHPTTLSNWLGPIWGISNYLVSPRAAEGTGTTRMRGRAGREDRHAASARILEANGCLGTSTTTRTRANRS